MATSKDIEKWMNEWIKQGIKEGEATNPFLIACGALIPNKVPHRSDTHLKFKGRWVTKTVLFEKRYEA
jgi:hypothetical protein